MGHPKRNTQQRDAARSGNPARRATAPPAISNQPHRPQPTRRVGAWTRTAAALIAALAVAAIAGSLLTAAPTPDQPPAQPTATYVNPPNSHTVVWASLVYEAQRFQALAALAAADNNDDYGFATTSTAAARTVQFTSPFATLTDYRSEGDSLRYCLRAESGEFITKSGPVTADTVADQTMTIGVGECDYTSGEIVTTTDGITEGADLLADMQPHYDAIVRVGGLTPTPVFDEVLDGTHAPVRIAALAAGKTLAPDDTSESSTQPESLTRTRLAALGYVLPQGLRLGFYDNHHDAGYWLCITDGTEEAIYESTPRSKVIRHTTGTCDGP